MAVTLIAHTEVGSGGVANVEFTSIPGTYDDLWIQMSIQGQGVTSNAVGYLMRFNSDTAINYSQTGVRNVGASPTTTRLQNFSYIIASQARSYASGTYYDFASASIYIPNYSNSSNNKQIIIEDGGGNMQSATDQYLNCWANLWRSTSAISSIQIGRLAFNDYKMAQYSTISLYGITKA